MEGVVYYCNKSGKHFRELMHSVKSLKSFNPKLKVALFTDRKLKSNLYFDYVFPMRDNIHPLQAKVIAILNSPFEKSLYLDVDTEVVKPLEVLFKYLDDHDLYLARELSVDFSHRPPKLVGFKKGNEFNTGLLLYNMTPLVKGFFETWKKEVLSLDKKKINLGTLDDQTVFNSFYNSPTNTLGLTIATLDNTIYGVRYWAYNTLNNLQKDKVAIKHWHMLNRSNFSIRVEGYAIFFIRKVFGLEVYQRA